MYTHQEALDLMIFCRKMADATAESIDTAERLQAPAWEAASATMKAVAYSEVTREVAFAELRNDLARAGTRADVAGLVCSRAVQALTDDPWQQEAYIAQVKRMAKDLAKGSEDPTVLMWCRIVAQYYFYSSYSDALIQENMLNDVDMSRPGFKALVRHSDAMSLRLLRAFRSLADVTRVRATEIEARVRRMSVVG